MHELNLDPSINLGGHKSSLNDLQYLQLSTFDAVQAFAYLLGIGGQNVPISAIQIVDRTNDFDLLLPAYIFASGKVFRADAAFAQAKASGGEYKFRIDTVNQADNPVEYESGDTYNVHIEQTMTLVHTTATGPQYITLSSLNSFNGFHSVTPAVSNLEAGYTASFKYKVFGRMLFANLSISGTIAAAGIVTAQLPYGMKFDVELVNVYAVANPGPSDQHIARMRTIPDTGSMAFGNYDTASSSQFDTGAFSCNISFMTLIKY